jgi:hypothetical protein
MLLSIGMKEEQGPQCEHPLHPLPLCLQCSIYEEGADGNPETEHHLAYIKYYEERSKDNTVESKKLTWAKRRQGGVERYWYDIIDVKSILGPVFIVPRFGEWGSRSRPEDFYLCPWQW